MSMFSSILSKIWGAAGASPAAAAAPSVSDTDPTDASVSSAAPAVAAEDGAGAAAQPAVDVEAVLTEMAAKNGQKLNWHQSIVDMLKLLGLDSSLDSRKLLADELGYSGDTNDSATMNVWLHKAVMQKLAENGGTVPDSLKV